MNNKGFTLIELLAVLVILVAIMLIAIPSITSSLERNKDKQYQAKVELIISNAELYASDKKIRVSELCVKTSTLRDEGYVTSRELENPKGNNDIDGYVSYDGSLSKLQFTEGSPTGSCNQNIVF